MDSALRSLKDSSKVPPLRLAHGPLHDEGDDNLEPCGELTPTSKTLSVIVSMSSGAILFSLSCTCPGMQSWRRTSRLAVVEGDEPTTRKPVPQEDDPMAHKPIDTARSIS